MAGLDAQLIVWEFEGKVAAPTAMAECLQAALSCDKESSHKSKVRCSTGSHVSSQRTSEYV